MNWFSGPIQDAIASAKHSKKIFLVFIEGKDETSKNMSALISKPDISQHLSDNCVSVKLSTDSESYRQFSQIYPVIVVPCMFFIGDNGIPLEVIAGTDSEGELSTKVQSAIQLHKVKISTELQQTSTTGSTNLPTITGGATTSREIQEEPQKAEAVSNEKGVDVPLAKPTSDSDSMDEAEARRLLQQKLERAEQLLTQRRILKEKERIEEEKRQELEHRRVGRELQRAREEMKDKEMNDWAKQRQKEKQEDKAARERILAQIAQDKADRAAKFQYSTGQASSAPSPEASPPPEVRQRSLEGTTSANANIARIQFRLPNSTARTYQFSSDSTLADVIDQLNTVVQPLFPSGFSLATTFPRRHFARCDYPRTLRELELIPTAVLLVLPLSAASPAITSGSGGLWSLLWTLLSPLTMIWGYAYSLVFGRTTPRTPPPTATGAGDNQPSTSRNSASQGPVNPNVNRYRRDGNVHRLANESSNEDEDGTWNGNSTQQM